MSQYFLFVEQPTQKQLTLAVLSGALVLEKKERKEKINPIHLEVVVKTLPQDCGD